MINVKNQAKSNLLALALNPYPGRGIILGKDETGRYLVQIYWIMGRSENSRNRIFVCKDNIDLKTKAADPSKVSSTELTIYTAMSNDQCNYVVSNGHQTDDVLTHCDTFLGMSNFIESQDFKYKYEPDKPNFTPRITGIITLDGPKPFAELLILKKSPFGMACDKQLFRYDSFKSGYGYCITTYAGDGNPLPPFNGEPLLLPLNGDIDEMANEIWGSLNEENRVSLAVKTIDIQTQQTEVKIINKYESVK